MPVKTDRKGRKFGIVVSQFNELIAERLLKGCLTEFAKQGIPRDKLVIVHVPGAFELPVTAFKLAKRKDITAVICLGAVIRGETFHFELISREAARGIMQVSLETQKPIIFGVLTTDTIDQALARSEDRKDNKGRDAVTAALAMTDVL